MNRRDIENEIRWETYPAASGPGGQNVNRTATAVRLRFPVRESRCLPGAVKERLLRLAGRRVTAAGELVIEARRHRTQAANRRDALERFHRLLDQAGRIPRVRRPTAPSRSARERRLRNKAHRSRIKQARRPPGRWEE